MDHADFNLPIPKKLLALWVQLRNEEDQAGRLALLLSSVHSYGHACNLSNAVNDRQGKSRFVYYGESRTLSEYSLEEGVDEYVNKHLEELFINTLNTYLEDKQTLPDGVKKSIGVLNRVKTLLIRLFTTGQYGILIELNIPDYIKSQVDLVFSSLEDTLDDITMDFTEYLRDTDNNWMADRVDNLGVSFWGDVEDKTTNNFTKYFGRDIQNINNYDEVYKRYVTFHGLFLKVTRTITAESLFEIFDITSSSYTKTLIILVNEFQLMFDADTNLQLIQKFIYA